VQQQQPRKQLVLSEAHLNLAHRELGHPQSRKGTVPSLVIHRVYVEEPLAHQFSFFSETLKLVIGDNGVAIVDGVM
jgi:hypothetical protein